MAGKRFFRCSVCGVAIFQGDNETGLEFGNRCLRGHMRDHIKENLWPGFRADMQTSWRGMFHPLETVTGDRVPVAMVA